MLSTEFSLDRTMFRAYDIRGIVKQQLTPAAVWAIGAAFGAMAREKNQNTVVVARDGRLSGPDLQEALMAGLLSSGCDVINIGVVPTPVLYFATEHFSTGAGIMVTGSHNPPEYNGLKMMLEGTCLAQEAIQSIADRIDARAFTEGQGLIRTADIAADYVQQMLQTVTIHRPLKVVVDAGNGVAGPLACDALVRLGVNIVPLYCDIDGRFPHHHPNPSDVASLADLIETVRKTQADIGLAFDGDGDRLGVVTSEGRVVWPDQLLGLFSQSLLSRKPNSTIVFDVKCSTRLAQTIEAANGIPVMSKTGHSLIKKSMKANGALLGGEMSGHFFFAENWYGFDDGLLAAVRLLEILSQSDDLKKLWASLPESCVTPEINIPIQDDEKFQWMAQFIERADFEDARKITIDGLRVEWSDGWGLVRVSNTTPCLVLRFEANTPAALARIQQAFKTQIEQIPTQATLALDF
jgi:phosphomannomutase/phosphoglucomutase